MIDFESLGYKDLTKDKPIHFMECLGEFFDNTYPYNQRFYKQEGNITTMLKVGNVHDIVLISGICYYSKGWEKFELILPEKYIVKMFEQTLNAVKQVIKNKLNYDNKTKSKSI